MRRNASHTLTCNRKACSSMFASIIMYDQRLCVTQWVISSHGDAWCAVGAHSRSMRPYWTTMGPRIQPPWVHRNGSRSGTIHDDLKSTLPKLFYTPKNSYSYTLVFFYVMTELKHRVFVFLLDAFRESEFGFRSTKLSKSGPRTKTRPSLKIESDTLEHINNQ